MAVVSFLDCRNTIISEVKLISPFFAQDERGALAKTFEKRFFLEAGIDSTIREVLYSFSHKGVLRGLHFQREHSQDKLVQVLVGAAYDVAVDLRAGSPTFGKWEGFELTAENRRLLYIPRGFAHGFLALEEGTLFSYLCGDQYDPQTDGGIRWNDPDVGVDWPLDRVGRVIVSEKDASLPSLKAFTERYGTLKG